MRLSAYILALCGVYSVRSIEISVKDGILNAEKGTQVQVNCSAPNSVTWQASPTSAMPTKQVSGSVGASGDNISTLTFDSINESNEGTFTCQDSTRNEESSFELRVFQVDKTEPEFEFQQDTLLHCNVMDSTKTFSYSWEKDGQPVSDIKVEGNEAFVTHENGSLEIRQPSRKLAGVYHCLATYEDANAGDQTIDIVVNYFATPKVIPFEKSKNLVQDEPLVIECEVLGHPKPAVSWSKDGKEILGEEGSRYKLSSADTYNGKSIDNAKLRIDSVDFDDAGDYYCVASYYEQWPNFNSTQKVLVRVKDKLAALWPFLGIVGEVIILCAIIFIYEKKRNKDAAAEEDLNQDGATPEKKSEGVRHRGSTNNPRA